MSRFLTVIILFFIVANSSAKEGADGPLGIYMGMPIEELDSLPKAIDRSHRFVLNEAPDPNPFVWSIIVTAPPNIGVCEIHGSSYVLTDEESDLAIQSFLTEFSKAYGIPLREIGDMEEEYVVRWESVGANQLPDQLKKVTLIKRPHDQGRNPKLPEELKWWVEVLFTFKNAHLCETWVYEFEENLR